MAYNCRYCSPPVYGPGDDNYGQGWCTAEDEEGIKKIVEFIKTHSKNKGDE